MTSGKFLRYIRTAVICGMFISSVAVLPAVLFGCAVSTTHPKLVRFGSSGNYGMKDSEGHVVVPIGQYTGLPRRMNAAAVVYSPTTDKWVLLSPSGSEAATVLLPQGSTLPDSFSDDCVRIVSDQQRFAVGFANSAGKVVLPPQFRMAMPFVGGHAAVVPFSGNVPSGGSTDADAAAEPQSLSGSELWGVIDKNGKFVKNAVYTRAFNTQLQTFIFSSPSESFYFTPQGEIKIF